MTSDGMKRLLNFSNQAADGIDIIGEVLDAWEYPVGHPQWQRIVVRQMATDIHSALASSQPPDDTATRELVEALEWYGEQARLARLIHSGGDAGRHNLAEDGGKYARTVIARYHASKGYEDEEKAENIVSGWNDVDDVDVLDVEEDT